MKVDAGDYIGFRQESGELTIFRICEDREYMDVIYDEKYRGILFHIGSKFDITKKSEEDWDRYENYGKNIQKVMVYLL